MFELYLLLNASPAFLSYNIGMISYVSTKQFLNETDLSATALYQKTNVELMGRKDSRVWLCYIDLLDNPT